MTVQLRLPRVEQPDKRCRSCGYGIAADRRPGRCPMCGGRHWVLNPRARREPAVLDGD